MTDTTITENTEQVRPFDLELDVEHVDVEDSGRSVEEVLGERYAEAETRQSIDPADLAAPPMPYVPLKDRGRRGKIRVDPYAVARLTERPEWHSVEAPESVRRAWLNVAVAADSLDAAIDRVLNVEVDKVTERREYEAVIIEQAEADPEGTQPTPQMRGGMDWEAETLARETRFQVAHRALTAAREAYGDRVTEALPEWRAVVVAALPRLSAASNKAVTAADSAVREQVAAVAAARAIDEQIEPKPAWHRSVRTGLARAALTGLSAAREYVSSDDPVVTGRYLVTGDDMAPPSWTREVLAGSASERDFWLLGAIEAADDFRATGYTQPGQRHHFGELASPELGERLRRKDLSADPV